MHSNPDCEDGYCGAACDCSCHDEDDQDDEDEHSD
jgi:hypothetical protein